MQLTKRLAVLFVGLSFFSSVTSHPLGDFLSYDSRLYWVYVCPIQSPNHQACIMSIDETGQVKEWKRSQHGASDWILSRSMDNQFYFIERYYNNSEDTHMAKVFKLVDGKAQSVTSWYKDEYRVGEAGFIVLEDESIVFTLRGKMKHKTRNGKVSNWSKYSQYVQKFRALTDGTLLLIHKDGISQINLDGKTIRKWDDLIQKQEGDAPLMGNRIFDADFHRGKLYIAYWGNRRFEVISTGGTREVIKQYDTEGPWVPHSISVHLGKAYGLASHLMGQNPGDIYPQLIEFDKNENKVIWTKNK